MYSEIFFLVLIGWLVGWFGEGEGEGITCVIASTFATAFHGRKKKISNFSDNTQVLLLAPPPKKKRTRAWEMLPRHFAIDIQRHIIIRLVWFSARYIALPVLFSLVSRFGSKSPAKWIDVNVNIIAKPGVEVVMSVRTLELKSQSAMELYKCF